MTISPADASTLCDDLAIESNDSNVGTIETWGEEIVSPDEITSSDARNLCYALRIDDGSNVDVILAWSATLSGATPVPVAPAAADVATTGDPVAPSSADASASSSGSPADGTAPAA